MTGEKRVDLYVEQVLDHIPAPARERDRIGADVASHVRERVAAGATAEDAAAQMGEPAEVARAYLAEVPMRMAPLSRRVGAFLVDVVLGFTVVLAMFLAFGLGAIGLKAFESAPVPIAIGIGLAVGIGLSAFVLSIVYFPLCESLWGQTVGKRLFEIYVAQEDGTRVSLWNAIVRRIPFVFEFFWLDALVALFTEKRQRAFDLVAKTVVVCAEPMQVVPAGVPLSGDDA